MFLNCGVGEDSWESDCREIKPVNPEGNHPWIFIGRTEAEAPTLWPPDAKSWLIGKDPDAGKDWEKEVTEDEMVGQQHWPNGLEFKQTRTEWRTGKPDVLQSMGSQRAGHNLATEQDTTISSITTSWPSTMSMDWCWQVTVTRAQQADDRSALCPCSPSRREDPSDLFSVLLWILSCHGLLYPPMSWVNQSLSWYLLNFFFM